MANNGAREGNGSGDGTRSRRCQLTVQLIVQKLLRGAREVKIDCSDERDAINLYNDVRHAINAKGLKGLDDVSVCLAPERAIIRVPRRQRAKKASDHQGPIR